MFSDLRIYIVIGIFMIACIALMVFNFAIIHYSKKRNSPTAGEIEKWKGVLYKEINTASNVQANKSNHEKFLLRELSKPGNLVAYAHALQCLKSEFPEAYSNYIQTKHTVFQRLAYLYSKKSRIERTCYADFICTFPQAVGDSHEQLVDMLISYIEDSNIHCRTKVLGALCSIGSVPGVTNVLQLIHDRNLFMHDQLLTNELSNFNGDKEILGDSLWNESRQWNDNITVSVIQFITRFSSRYSDVFLPFLQDTSATPEVRAAIIRYYGEHRYEPVRPILTELAADLTNSTLAATAKSALTLYSASDAIVARKIDSSESNLHAQQNERSSLLKRISVRVAKKATA